MRRRPRPQRGELGNGQARERLSARRPLREQPVDVLDEHEALRACLTGHPRGDRIGRHLQDVGEPVERQLGGQQHDGAPGAGKVAGPGQVGA